MNQTHKILLLAALTGMSFSACKTKKMMAKTTSVTISPPPPVESPKPQPQPVTEEAEAAPVEKPNFNLDNIQFEFNSFVLKTSSLPILDRAVAEMKKAPGTKFVLHGHSSAEGSPAHNLSLSIDRANAVKSYFINAGLNGNDFTIVGHGEKEPIASNATEDGRMKNRRTEIKVQP